MKKTMVKINYLPVVRNKLKPWVDVGTKNISSHGEAGWLTGSHSFKKKDPLADLSWAERVRGSCSRGGRG
jgi:hypothetical protein